MDRYGVTIPLNTVPLSAHRRIVEELPDLGYTDAWTGEAGAYDGFTPITLAAAWSRSLRVGTGVVPVQTRGPALLAMTVATLAEAAPGRVVVGVGSSGPPFVTRINGIPFEHPYRRVRDTVRFLKAALAGEYVMGDFDSFSIEGFRLTSVPRPAPPVMVGALRPQMLRLAGSEADGLVTNFLAADDVPRVVEAMGPEGKAKEVVARIFVCPTRDRDYARAQGRAMLGSILNARTYSAFHDWLGRSDVLAASHRAWAAGDFRGAGAAVPDRLVDELLVHGSPEECRAHVARYVEAGVVTPLLAVIPAPEFGAGPDGMLSALRALAPVC
ncbi:MULTISPECIES: LLM class F420-dependent oxidoreductase [unclassified Streptomyces]|uniref:LLM class F420-dependent oxidoreductase n=1 Tax=unclassified Streptomyces TaxID=2593676 RepID=UPI00081D487E|nr:MULTISPECIES: LLM class F420-dependent oxidoreductase [unclassified Streptomyces]MYZ35644.1 LLM class F420-dependent oxidoreductase [Streptomyces sp. SID4917]SCF77146.1 probable F420-dependent oxidoreductase, Rv3093c family [Streptomyces sp. MnatMP-M17]